MKKLVLALTVIATVAIAAPADATSRRRARGKPAGLDPQGYARLNRLTDETGLLVADEDARGRVVMSDELVSVVMCPGMSTVVVDGNPVVIGSSIIADDAGVLIPLTALARITDVVREAILRGVRKVVIDPGHGGRDTGAIGAGGLQEKSVNLSVSLRLAKILEKRGVEVVLTRNKDVFIELDERVRICNRERPDLFVSIHANAARARDITGVETFYVRETIDDFDRALHAAREDAVEIQGVEVKESERDLRVALYHTMFDMSRRRSREVATKVNKSMWKRLDSPDRGVREAGFRVLKGAKCPALLVEMGFLSNGETERKLLQGNYLDKVAEAVAAGILDLTPTGRGDIDEQ